MTTYEITDNGKVRRVLCNDTFAECIRAEDPFQPENDDYLIIDTTQHVGAPAGWVTTEFGKRRELITRTIPIAAIGGAL